MFKPIVWSLNAQEDVLHIANYLIENWGELIAKKYVKSIDELTQSISTFPKLYPMINKRKRIRKCVISKHNSIFYRERRETVEIVNIFDNRQNPNKVKF